MGSTRTTPVRAASSPEHPVYGPPGVQEAQGLLSAAHVSENMAIASFPNETTGTLTSLQPTISLLTPDRPRPDEPQSRPMHTRNSRTAPLARHWRAKCSPMLRLCP